LGWGKLLCNGRFRRFAHGECSACHVNLHSPSCLIQVGTDVAVSVHHFGFYSLNACRIVYIVDEDDPMKRLGFAYGTLAEHATRRRAIYC
jgi:uncharacterized protein (UPF0548 family)